MSAIAGIVGFPPKGEAAEKMFRTMRRRGFDGRGGYFCQNCCILGAVFHNGTEEVCALTELTVSRHRYVLVYDGELYNGRKIRGELENLGHEFTGNSTGEILIHAYAQWKETCLSRFNGSIVMAVWEEGSGLFLARDRMGVKPLFYMLQSTGILFASEIKTILAYPGVEAELDAQGAAELFLLGPGSIPGSGVLKNIRSLEPGCYGILKEGKWNTKRYWKLYDREHQESFEETAQHVRALVTDAAVRQTDSRTGCFLSGGLDSGILSAIGSEIRRKENRRLDTFSLDFQNNDIYFVSEKFQPSSDTHYIEIMERFLNSHVHRTVLSAQDQTEALKEAMIARDIPGMADVDSSMLLVCREIVKHVPSILSGECADEIFGGYPWYRDPEIRSKDGFPWSQNLNFRIEFLTDSTLQQVSPREFVMDQYADTIRCADILPGTDETEKRVKQMVVLNMRWFMQTLLDRTDRMSTAGGGLTVRMPFCDYRVAEYLYGVPWAFKEYHGQEKGLLRYAFRDMLPEQICFRKKSPYPKSYDPVYLEMVSAELQRRIEKKDAPILKIVRRKTLQKLLSGEEQLPWYGQLMKKPQTIAYMLQLNDWMEEYGVKIV